VFCSKPSTKFKTYDIVFSTSVIEHVRDDENFVGLIADLLKDDGVAVFTCDFNDAYRPGDRIPKVDHRFYTQHDLKVRLLGKMKDCVLIDTPRWDSPPDFRLGGCVYSFASFVVRKQPLTTQDIQA